VDVLRALAGFVTLVFWMGAWAQLLGMPVAWLRLRGTPAWRERPEGVRRIDLLAMFLARVTAVTMVWGIAVAIIAAIGGAGFSGGALYLILFGAPVIFVPWWVLQQDAAEFPRIVSGLRRR
jgi:hypothetical protein